MSPVGNLKHDFKIGENISPEFKDWISNAINRGGSNLHNIRNVRNLNVAHKREKEDESRPLRDALAPKGVGQMLVAPPSLIKKYVAYTKREERPVNFTDFVKNIDNKKPAPPPIFIQNFVKNIDNKKPANPPIFMDQGSPTSLNVKYKTELYEIPNVQYHTMTLDENIGGSKWILGYEGCPKFPPIRIKPRNIPPWDPAEAGWNPIDISILLNGACAVNNIDEGENVIMFNLSMDRGENVKVHTDKVKAKKVRVVFKNVLSQGQKIFKIVSIDGVKTHEDLPIKYLQGNTLFYMYNVGTQSSLKLKSSEDDRSPAFAREVSVRVGEFVGPEMKGWIIRTLRRGSEELKKVNAEVDKLKAEWEGKEDVIII